MDNWKCSNNLLAKFLIEIRDLHYVVQRHWENFPEGLVEGHPDIDLFVSEKDNEEILNIVKKYPRIPIDVRSPEDGYYPFEIGMALLTDRVIKERMFWVPNPKAHFLSLYYHNLVHKGNNPYGKDLEKIFKEAYPPVRCSDQGVGYNV